MITHTAYKKNNFGNDEEKKMDNIKIKITK